MTSPTRNRSCGFLKISHNLMPDANKQIAKKSDFNLIHQPSIAHRYDVIKVIGFLCYDWLDIFKSHNM